MRRLITMALSAGVVLAGTAGLAAQGPSAAPPRPFSNVFTNPSPSAQVPPALSDALRKALRKELQGLPKVPLIPSGTKCHIIVVPVDPTIDPHFSLAPASTTRFLLREIPTDRVCR